MERESVLLQLNTIFVDVLDDNSISLTEESTAADVEEWDSLNHIHLVVSFEKTFDIRFSSEEIQSWMSVGDILDSILEKVG